MIGELGAELLKQIYLAEQTQTERNAIGETLADSVVAETVQHLKDYGLVVDMTETQEEQAMLHAAHVTPRGLSVLCHLGIL